jgi:sn-glycerol 3-phosphate transport system permease protein
MTDAAASSPVPERRAGSQAWWNAVNAWLLLLPAAVLLIAFTHWPILATIRNSLFITRRNGTEVFVGLDSYQAMAADPIFWKALTNNFWFALGTIPTSIALALLMAIWVNRNMRGRGLLRLAYFTPTVLPMIAVANIWLFFYTPDYGLLDQLRGLFGFGWNWLGDPSTVMGCLIVMVIWKEAGFFMIFYLAALQQLSPDLDEAASIEGASRWYIFRRITFPLLMPTTLFVAINAVINSFKLVDHLVIMTKGGPNNASTLLLYYVYEVAFTFQDSSYAATLTVVLLILLSAVALIKFGYLDRRIHYQ